MQSYDNITLQVTIACLFLYANSTDSNILCDFTANFRLIQKNNMLMLNVWFDILIKLIRDFKQLCSVSKLFKLLFDILLFLLFQTGSKLNGYL